MHPLTTPPPRKSLICSVFVNSTILGLQFLINGRVNIGTKHFKAAILARGVFYCALKSVSLKKVLPGILVVVRVKVKMTSSKLLFAVISHLQLFDINFHLQ